MIQPVRKSNGFCYLDQQTRGWAIDSGIRVSLAPGRYRITGKERLNGILYLHLDERFRLDVFDLPDDADSQRARATTET